MCNGCEINTVDFFARFLGKAEVLWIADTEVLWTWFTVVSVRSHAS